MWFPSLQTRFPRLAFWRHLLGHELFISFMTLAELERWALTRRWGAARRQRLQRYLRRFGPVTSNWRGDSWGTRIRT